MTAAAARRHDAAATVEREGIAVVIPAFDAAAHLESALASVLDAMAYLNHAHPTVPGEVVVVDDGSTDGTLELARRNARLDGRIRVVRHRVNRGAAAARNTGVRSSRGAFVSFLDADETYLERHLYVSFEILRKRTDVHAVSTRVRLDGDVHPEWRAAIESTAPSTLSVRRWCHDFLGGFMEDDVLRTYPCEDVVYRRMLDRFFVTARPDEVTVQLTRRPGNALDRQWEKFCHPPGAGIAPERPEEVAAKPVVRRLVEARLTELAAKRRQSANG